ncbi:MAG: hypothetical protein R6W99_10480 [Clostridia bacterium]
MLTIGGFHKINFYLASLCSALISLVYLHTLRSMGASIASPEAKFFSSGLGLNLYPFTAIHTKNSTAGIDILHPAVFVQYVWLTAFSSVFCEHRV